MLNKHDRARIERLSQRIDEYQRRASETDDPVKRNRYLVKAKRAEKTRQLQRTFPGSIIFWGLAVNVVLLPWALFTHAGREGPGVALSLVVLGLLVIMKLRLRSRSE